ncbi:hypothetical protein MROS_2328 [Melioribacter roseus P3M-2]|uniref:Tagaturonate/fructuronate epimerase n=2 Tax=Melioribacter TaxID=1134403 RepID=I7A2X4_MELRP|nr:tagaturonate epimerase family protein [Melioribacter roseus]AFN75558.1 hypothetical protein MROS_2328 [Melioribacter roseus P3M-2]
MEMQKLYEEVENKNIVKNDLVDLTIGESLKIKAYPLSVLKKDDAFFFIGKENYDKFLFVISAGKENGLLNEFEGELIDAGKDVTVKKCNLSTKNRKAVQKIFPHTAPIVLGLCNSFGCGDRLGVANAGHIRAIKQSNFRPILAQQSIRELTRTNRTPDDVMDAAVWAVLQEGYKDGFGSDADHLKTFEDIDLMLNAGFTMFTFDPSEHVDNEADNYSEDQLKQKLGEIDWSGLQDTSADAAKRYVDMTFNISERLSLTIQESDFLRAYAKYGNAIAHIKKMYDYLASKADKDTFEIEVSVDETESVTSPFEHFFFANELNRLGVKYVSLAPRFIGDFEKGIDYKGDLNVFKTEYEKHLDITKYFGSYKISLHSGSDKFSAYRVIGSLKGAYTHVKTAGTSYLEALRVVAAKEPALFRDILDFCRDLYETEKRSYHVSADINKVKPANQYSDTELIELFNQNDTRQVLHVTFGKVLTEKDSSGHFLFKDKIMKCLVENEESHYEFLEKHFLKHLECFK